MYEGEKIQLALQEVEAVACKDCGELMANVDAHELKLGDLTILKKAGVKVSNPDTEEDYCITCEYDTFGKKIADFFSSDDDDDDSSFFGGGTFGGGWSGGDSDSSSGGFGGFGGGSFSGGGASASF